MNNAKFYIDNLKLQPHPEGGYYRETYKSREYIPALALKDFNGSRSYSTAIYYLLQQMIFLHFIK